MTDAVRVPAVLVVGLFLAMGAPASAQPPAAPDVVSGKVFLDANGNGRLDAGERGLAGVRVTDGVAFVSTGEDGAYRLAVADDYMIPYRPARTVAVCWPSGKWPVGRWWVRLSEVSDSAGVNFALREDVQKLPFAFVHMSDDHGQGAMYSQHYGPAVRRMGEAVKFCFNTGDMGYATPEGAQTMFRNIAEHAGKFPVPVFITPGNHDFVYPDKEGKIRVDADDLAGHGAMTKYCGPVRWSFDYAGVHFISLDYIEKTPKLYEDQIPRVAIEWARRDLAVVKKGTRVILLVHCYNARADFFDLLREFKPEYVCCGHTHTPSHARLAGVPCHTNYGLCTMVVTESSLGVTEGLPPTFKDRAIFGYFRGVVQPAMEKRRQKHHSLGEATLGARPRCIEGDPGAESAELVIEIEPGSSRRVALRFGQRQSAEIAFDGKTVDVAGAPFPVPLPPDHKTLRWHILMDRDRLTIFGNDVFRTTKAVTVDAPARLAVTAEGDGARLVKADLWELRPVRAINSRALHHFPPPGWYWGRGYLVGACLEQDDPHSREMLGRYSADGIMDYDVK